MPAVTVVIPTWNGAEILPIALESLRRQRFQDFETLVVDNGSTDDTAAMVGRSFPEVRLLELPENRGFAGAVNAGIAGSRTPLVALLNNDAEVDPGWLEALVAALEQWPTAGAAASRVLQRRDPTRIDSAGDTMGVLATSIGHDDLDGPAYARPGWVPSACAAAALYRMEAIRDVGPLDERFFAYLEDVDLGLRLLLAGWRTRYVPDAIALHEGSVTADRMGPLKLRLLLLNSGRLFVQNAPLGRLILFGPLLAPWILIRALREGRPGAGPAALLALLRDLPVAVAARRRRFRRRRISRAAYRAALAPPLTRGFHRPPPPSRPGGTA